MTTDLSAAPKTIGWARPGAFVLFDQTPDWSGRTLQRKFAATFPNHADAWKFPEPLATESAALVTLGSENIANLCIDIPVPGADFSQEVWRSPWWPEAEKIVARHRAHVLMVAGGSDEAWAALGPDERLERAQMFARLTAAFASLDGATTVNWIEGGSLLPAAPAVEIIKSGPPTAFWVRNWRFDEAQANGSPGVGCFSIGLRMFAGRELHFHPVSPDRGEEIAGYANRLADYLIERGPVLDDGDTLEFVAGQKIEVRHGQAPSGVLLYEIRL